MKRKEDLPALTGIRFLAALHVFALHLGNGGSVGGRAPFYLQAPIWLRHFIRSGGAGVSLFFVLSGFIMAYVYAGTGVTRRNFYAARAARILPVLWLALLVTVPLDWRALLSHPGAFLATPALLQGWYTPWAYVWDSPAWSLACETAFYLLFPLLLPHLERLGRRELLVLAVGSGLIAALVPCLSVSARVLYTLPIARLPEFLCGSAVALWAGRGDEWRSIAPGLTVGGSVIVFATLATRVVPFDVGRQGLALAYAAIILGLSERHAISRLLSWAPLIALGDASYAFYLLHLPVARYLNHIVPQSNVLVALALGTTVAVCLALRPTFEASTRRALRARLMRTIAVEPAVARPGSPVQR